MSFDLQNIDKEILEEYYQRLLKTSHDYKYLQFVYLWEFLHNNSLFSQLCHSIREKSGARFMHDAYQIASRLEPLFISTNQQERMYLTYHVLEVINRTGNSTEKLMQKIGKSYFKENKVGDHDCFNLFNDLFLEPFILYLTHNVSRNLVFLTLLKKYVRKTEWFNRERLYSFVINDSSSLERILTSDLYSFLFDQGWDFHIEPVSPNGELDLIASQKSSPSITLVEGKVFDGKSRAKSYIIKGFHQVLTYCKDYGEDKAYMIVYNISDKTLCFNLGVSQEGFPIHQVDNRSIYFCVVHIFSNTEPASVRGKSDRIEINSSDLI